MLLLCEKFDLKNIYIDIKKKVKSTNLWSLGLCPGQAADEPVGAGFVSLAVRRLRPHHMSDADADWLVG